MRIFATGFNIISMSIGITIATVMFCFYLYQYIEEKKAAKEYEQSDVNPPQDDAKDDVVEGESAISGDMLDIQKQDIHA